MRHLWPVPACGELSNQLDGLQDVVDEKTLANSTAWSNLKIHTSLISNGPDCLVVPNAAPRRCGARLAGQPAGGVLPQGLGGGWAASRRAIPPAPLRRPPLVGCAAWDHIVEFFQGLGQVEAIFSIELRKRVIAQLSYAIGVAKLLSSLFEETALSLETLYSKKPQSATLLKVALVVNALNGILILLPSISCV